MFASAGRDAAMGLVHTLQKASNYAKFDWAAVGILICAHGVADIQ